MAKRSRSADDDYLKKVKLKLGDLFWYLVLLAYNNNLNVDEVVESNIKKAEAIYEKGKPIHHDVDYHPDEQLPRRISFDFSEREIDDALRVTIRVKGTIIGDKLSDNTYKPDDYRYHDVFHLAFMAVLGWSPVIRDLLKRKRKSNSDVDENEDGARAKIIEEAISLFVFNEAKRHWNFFEGIKKIDLGMLSTIKALTSELEVKSCTARQWEQAILLGYSIWRQLKENRGGRVSLDLDKAKMNYRPPVDLAHINYRRVL